MPLGRTSPFIDPTIAEYVAARSAQPDEVLLDLVTETAEATGQAAGMQISPDQGALLALLVGLCGAQQAIEIGTFTGYSAICIARALPDDGHLLCCDVSERYTAIARRAWNRAALGDRIELRLGPAIETLGALSPDERFDFAFVDADKPGYLGYVDALLPLMPANGLICVDNTLWSGRVTEPVDADTDANTSALVEFNDAIAGDDRVESYILPIGDGLTLIRKR